MLWSNSVSATGKDNSLTPFRDSNPQHDQLTITKVALAPFQTGSSFSGPFIGEIWAYVAMVAKPCITSVEVLMKLPCLKK